MTINFCPHCNQRYVVDSNISDYIHECNSGNDALDQDDVLIVGNWDDLDGDTGSRPAQEVMRAGMENQLQGTRAGIEGVKRQDLTRRGKVASLYRQTQHDEYINFTKEGLD